MRMTKARRDILKIFNENDKPLNAEQLSKILEEDYDLSTIYRNLNFFEEQAILRSIVFSDKIKYYFTSKGHYHFVYCTKCKKFQKINKCFEEEFKKHINKKLDFEVKSHTLYFEGLCHDCKNRRDYDEAND
ncbi:Fur family transcriptional regulator [Geotoga petraea]|jgi:Fur family ferric uptake transcriptional regulator|uniref:Fur family transcriptional regulator, ferric uptake regulator n=1 Tax=Geotoga petraea TaxID=28234 RepID=A0A1G6L1R6_9BACT|nr:Fur family transcriptional regulator [Geotoga petraea]MDK2946643.1 Fur family transcriptional regulator, ferric uptake regulator [Geotoga sp.]TGG88808.1 transcriptional repressor [Geotoga petraea]SDC37133.1 Fur family transcriptional regulator, ferric uptake regulator [Geotoga petraea]